VRGPDLSALVVPLKAAAGVLSVAAFGNALHVAGRDAAAVEAAIAPWREQAGLRWQQAEANLEDVFISLIAAAPDNFANNIKQAA
jgi:ABC-2 type transport system ATP-binding protein